MRKGHIRSKHDVRKKDGKHDLMYAHGKTSSRKSKINRNSHNREKNYESYAEDRKRSKRKTGDLEEREVRVSSRKNGENKYNNRKGEFAIRDEESSNDNKDDIDDKIRYSRKCESRKRGSKKWEDKTNTEKDYNQTDGDIGTKEEGKVEKGEKIKGKEEKEGEERGSIKRHRNYEQENKRRERRKDETKYSTEKWHGKGYAENRKKEKIDEESEAQEETESIHEKKEEEEEDEKEEEEKEKGDEEKKTYYWEKNIKMESEEYNKECYIKDGNDIRLTNYKPKAKRNSSSDNSRNVLKHRNRSRFSASEGDDYSNRSLDRRRKKKKGSKRKRNSIISSHFNDHKERNKYGTVYDEYKGKYVYHQEEENDKEEGKGRKAKHAKTDDMDEEVEQGEEESDYDDVNKYDSGTYVKEHFRSDEKMKSGRNYTRNMKRERRQKSEEMDGGLIKAQKQNNMWRKTSYRGKGKNKNFQSGNLNNNVDGNENLCHEEDLEEEEDNDVNDDDINTTNHKKKKKQFNKEFKMNNFKNKGRQRVSNTLFNSNLLGTHTSGINEEMEKKNRVNPLEDTTKNNKNDKIKNYTNFKHPNVMGAKNSNLLPGNNFHASLQNYNGKNVLQSSSNCFNIDSKGNRNEIFNESPLIELTKQAPLLRNPTNISTSLGGNNVNMMVGEGNRTGGDFFNTHKKNVTQKNHTLDSSGGIIVSPPSTDGRTFNLINVSNGNNGSNTSINNINGNNNTNNNNNNNSSRNNNDTIKKPMILLPNENQRKLVSNNVSSVTNANVLNFTNNPNAINNSQYVNAFSGVNSIKGRPILTPHVNKNPLVLDTEIKDNKMEKGMITTNNNNLNKINNITIPPPPSDDPNKGKLVKNVLFGTEKGKNGTGGGGGAGGGTVAAGKGLGVPYFNENMSSLSYGSVKVAGTMNRNALPSIVNNLTPNLTNTSKMGNVKHFENNISNVNLVNMNPNLIPLSTTSYNCNNKVSNNFGNNTNINNNTFPNRIGNKNYNVGDTMLGDTGNMNRISNILGNFHLISNAESKAENTTDTKIWGINTNKQRSLNSVNSVNGLFMNNENFEHANQNIQEDNRNTGNEYPPKGSKNNIHGKKREGKKQVNQLIPNQGFQEHIMYGKHGETNEYGLTQYHPTDTNINCSMHINEDRDRNKNNAHQLHSERNVVNRQSEIKHFSLQAAGTSDIEESYNFSSEEERHQWITQPEEVYEENILKSKDRKKEANHILTREEKLHAWLEHQLENQTDIVTDICYSFPLFFNEDVSKNILINDQIDHVLREKDKNINGNIAVNKRKKRNSESSNIDETRNNGISEHFIYTKIRNDSMPIKEKAIHQILKEKNKKQINTCNNIWAHIPPNDSSDTYGIHKGEIEKSVHIKNDTLPNEVFNKCKTDALLENTNTNMKSEKENEKEKEKEKEKEINVKPVESNNIQLEDNNLMKFVNMNLKIVMTLDNVDKEIDGSNEKGEVHAINREDDHEQVEHLLSKSCKHINIPLFFIQDRNYKAYLVSSLTEKYGNVDEMDETSKGLVRDEMEFSSMDLLHLNKFIIKSEETSEEESSECEDTSHDEEEEEVVEGVEKEKEEILVDEKKIGEKTMGEEPQVQVFVDCDKGEKKEEEQITSEEDLSEEEKASEEDSSDEDSSDEDTSDEDTSDEDTSDENNSDENNSDENNSDENNSDENNSDENTSDGETPDGEMPVMETPTEEASEE